MGDFFKLEACLQVDMFNFLTSGYNIKCREDLKVNYPQIPLEVGTNNHIHFQPHHKTLAHFFQSNEL